MRLWDKLLVVLIVIGSVLLFACVANEDIEAHRDAAEAAKAVILSEGEVARREQLAYYRGWQDGKQYYAGTAGVGSITLRPHRRQAG